MFLSNTVKKCGIACVVFAGLFSMPAAPVGAVIIRGTGNTTAPLDDPGWANLGRRNGSSAVYLEDRWVLTAAHVGPGTTNFGGTDYNMVGGSWHRLHDPDPPNGFVDLGLYRIDGVPAGVVDLTISSSTPPGGSDLLAIGYGKNRAATETEWFVDTDPVFPDPWVWQESTFGDADINLYGFKYGSGNTKRWGENNLEGTTKNAYGWGNTYLFDTIFDQFGGHGNDEMQAATNDSGGGVFFKNGSDWELAGIMTTVGVYSGQGSLPLDKAVYGNRTYSADLRYYRNEIMSVIPEPSTLVLAMVGLLSLALYGCRRKR